MEFQGRRINQAYYNYKLSIMSPEYHLQIFLIRCTNNVNFHEYASGEQIIGYNIKGGINNNDNKNIADHARVSRYFDNRLP